MHFQRLVGEKCYLSPVTPDDADKCAKWLNDSEVMQNIGMVRRIWSLEMERAFLSTASTSDDPIFLIVDRQSDKVIGSCGLFDIQAVDRVGECGILIGDRSYWGRGYGVDALRLLLDFGFSILNLNNIMLNVYSFNQRAIHCYRKVGFKEIGVRRQAHVYCGKAYDIVYMDILAEEFESPYLKPLFIESETPPADRLKIVLE